MSTSKLFGKDILITSTTNASGTTIGSISTLGGMNVNQTMLVSGALTSTADSNTIGNLFTTGGNVGFGTTSPVQRLDVNGNLNITGNFYQNGSVYSGSTQWGSTGANIYFNTGNVGIGTLTPTAKLQVEGEVNLNIMSGFNTSGLITLGRSDGVNRNSAIKVYNSTGGNSYMSFEIHNGTGGSRTTAMLMDGFGNVGIGTTSPGSALHVTGTINPTPIGTGVHIGTDSVNNASIIQINQGGNTSGSSILDFGYSNTNFVSRIIHDNVTKNLGFRVNSNQNDVLTLASSGNIGINTTVPSSRLHVVMGDATSAGSVTFWDSTYSVFGQASNTGGGVGIGYNSASGGCLVSLSPNIAWQPMTYRGANHQFVISGTAGTPPSMILNSSGNLGIGTTAPQTNFHVAGGGVQIGASNTAGVHMQALNGALNVWRGTWGSGTVTFCSDSRGNFGIGTHTPAYALDVNGSLRSTGDIFIGNGTNAEALNLWDIPGAAWQLSTGSYNLNIRNGTVGSTMVNRVTVTSTGNVGIGTTTPIGKISVDYSGISTNQNVLSLHTSNTGTTDYNLIEAGHGASSTFVLKGNGNLGIGTSTPSYPLDISNSVSNSNQPFMRLGNSTGGAGNQVGIILSPFSPRTGGPSSQIISIDDGNASAHLTLWTSPSGTATASVERVRIQNNGNVGIGTASPAFTLDVNGTIARSGVKVPRFDNGSFSGSASFSVPILFNDTQYNYAEFRVRYITSAICNINISATSYVNAAMSFSECALTTVKWNAQGSPVYSTFTTTTSGLFADTVEMVGIDNNLIFRIVRATGTSSTGLRNHYSYDNTYCWSGIGTARGYGQGHIDCASVGGSPLQFVTFTCSTGTISGTYSTVHYY